MFQKKPLELRRIFYILSYPNDNTVGMDDDGNIFESDHPLSTRWFISEIEAKKVARKNTHLNLRIWKVFGFILTEIAYKEKAGE